VGFRQVLEWQRIEGGQGGSEGDGPLCNKVLTAFIAGHSLAPLPHTAHLPHTAATHAATHSAPEAAMPSCASEKATLPNTSSR